MRLNKFNTESKGNNQSSQEKTSVLIFVVIFLLMAFGMAVAGYNSYHRYEQQFRSQVESELAAVAELKTSGLQNWLNERFADAETFYENPVFAELLQKFLKIPMICSCERNFKDG